MKPLFRKAVMKLYEEMSMPQAGIRTLFKTPASNISDTKTLNLDIIRTKRKVAIDIAPATGGHYNKFNLFTNKEYTPPHYDEYTDFKSADQFERHSGQTEYAPQAPAKTVDKLAKNLVKLGQIIDRAEIKQCHDALFVGKVTLINGDEVDYAKKVTHDFAPVVKWDAANPAIFNDIKKQIDVIVADSKMSIDSINMVCDPALISLIIATVKATSADYVDPSLFQRSAITMPTDVNMDGMQLHGKFSIGGYTVILWSYDDRYEIPLGYGIANEGTETTYIPSGSALLFPANVRFDMLYAGIEVNDFSNNSFLSANFGLRNFNPKVVSGKRIPYAMPDMVSFNAVNYGLKSAFLAVPTAIDGFATISSALT